ncbi:hypothetical protein QJS10_CPB14g00440 [Acorus calamus]|uniref:Bifunctional inhibitor/plant lipid transfer protein/seed storage helical domain-containing protein n=1 Tax=Acorus calamus TaxID=4465 RepID=A0AAV9DG22_ACOCL|nr:hypothetical protein QJS10_CPB14g00440 [Acorus calamus]
MSSKVFLLVTVALALLLAHAPTPSVSVTCNPTELSPCLNAILYGSAPSGACCGKLREQKPCLCQYAKNPSYKGFVGSNNARKVSSTCGVPIPNC